MDPDATLEQIRIMLGLGLVEDDLEPLGELIESLDEWLASGGFPPKRWTQAFSAKPVRLRTPTGNQIIEVDGPYAYTVPHHIPDLHPGDFVQVANPTNRGIRSVEVTRIGTEFTGALRSILRVQKRNVPVSEKE